jgi:hypothetical protein
MLLKKIFTVCTMIFIGAQFLFSQNNQQYKYVSPLSNSSFISKNTNIIIRYGDEINRQSILNQAGIEVTGSLSGFHDFGIILSDDNKTLVLNMVVSFQPAEVVNVVFNSEIKTTGGQKLPELGFSFNISPMKGLLSNAVIKDDGEVVFVNEKSLSKNPVITASDSLPSNFPKIKVRNAIDPMPGYTFMSIAENNSGIGKYLLMIKNDGTPYWYKKDDDYALTDFKMQSNGMLSYGEVRETYTGVGGGKTVHKIMDSTYVVVDSFTCGNGYMADSHDFKLLPSGHALLISYDFQQVDMSKIAAGGNPGAYVAGSIIQELDSDKNVVFQWRSWDYISIAESYFDLTLAALDPMHANALDVDDDGNIIVSFRNISQVIKINRTTGEIMWRLGGAKNEFTFLNERQENAPLYFSRPHDVRSLSNGHITLFDNGLDHKPTYSRAVEYIIDEQNKTATLVWEYKHPDNVYGATQGSVQRLSNGNTMIGWGNASSTNINWPAATEVTSEDKIVYEILFETKGLVSYRTLKYHWKMNTDVAEVKIPEIWQGNDYVFNNSSDSTFAALRLEEFDGSLYNYVNVKSVQHAPVNPEFEGQAPIVLAKRVVVSSDLAGIKGELSFDALKFSGQYKPAEIIVYQRNTEGKGLFLPLNTSYNPVTKKLIVQIANFGEFIFCVSSAETAANKPLQLLPADSSSVNQTLPVKLCWTPIGYTNYFHLQVADNIDFNNAVVDQDSLRSSYFIFKEVVPDATYYWRVKAGNNLGESGWSEIFLFNTAMPFIKLETPNGGEKIQRGLQYYVKWNDNIDDDVIIELKKNGATYEIIDTVNSSGIYKWSVNAALPVGSDYEINVKSFVENTLYDASDSYFEIVDTTVTSIETEFNNLPIKYCLEQNYPNPFNPTTRIKYSIAEAGVVSLKIFDILGKQVEELVNVFKEAGNYIVNFNASKLSSGVYFYRIECNSFTNTKRMLLIK